MRLGVLYRDGVGILQDFVRAHMWCGGVSASDVELAAREREKDTPEQIAEAQRVASEWKAK